MHNIIAYVTTVQCTVKIGSAHKVSKKIGNRKMWVDFAVYGLNFRHCRQFLNWGLLVESSYWMFVNEWVWLYSQICREAETDFQRL